MPSDRIQVPAGGERVRYDLETGVFSGPGEPIIPVVCGEDGEPVVSSAQRVLDAGADEMGRTIHWMHVSAGDEAREQYGTQLPDDTRSAFKRFRLGLVGPLSGQTRRQLQTEARKQLSLDTEMRPTSHLAWTPSPVSTREDLDVVCFRDVTEDAAAGLEFEDGSAGAARIHDLLESESEGLALEDWPAGFGIRPISQATTERLVERAIEYALDRDRSRVTIVHQGDQLPATEGGFCQWAMEYFEAEYGDAIILEERFRAEYDAYPDDELVVAQRHTGDVLAGPLADPDEYDVLIAPALAGHYVAAVGATIAGGPGVTPAALLGDGRVLAGPVPGSCGGGRNTGLSNPIATIRAGCLLFETLGWDDAAGVVRDGIEATLADGVFTSDLARQTASGDIVSAAEFADRVIDHIHTSDEPSQSGSVRTTAEERAVIERMVAGVYNILFEDQIRSTDIELNQLRGEDEEADIYLPEVGINFRYWRRWSVERRLEVLIHELAHVENYDDDHEPAFYDRFVELTEIAAVLNAVADGVRTGAVHLGSGSDAVSVETPDELSIEFELEAEPEEMNLELELEWPISGDESAVSPAEGESESTDTADALVGASDEIRSLARFEVYQARDEEWR
ncbi:MAG: isocitrate/isopropylmalate family dehydrogenase [Halapricum sp.]